MQVALPCHIHVSGDCFCYEKKKKAGAIPNGRNGVLRHSADRIVFARRTPPLFFFGYWNEMIQLRWVGQKLTSYTDTGPPIEWEEIPPSSFPFTPSLRSKNIGVFPINIFATVGGVDAVHTSFTFFDEDWREPIRATAKGEGGIFVCVSEVARH